MPNNAAVSPMPYFRLPGSGPDCSTDRSARLRQRRFAAGYERRDEPETYSRLAGEIKEELLRYESADPAIARARALYYAVANCPITIEDDVPFLGGEDPFFFNLMLPALQADAYARSAVHDPPDPVRTMRGERLFFAPCFEGHITPGLEQILAQGIEGIRKRLCEGSRRTVESGDSEGASWYKAAELSCDNVLLYADRYRRRALELAESAESPERAHELREEAEILKRVPAEPARTFREALQSYWIVYALVTLEMGGCNPGGGLGLGRMDQYLYPYLARDFQARRLNRDEAVELLEIFLLQFRHIDYYTPHQMFTPGSQTSLGGVTPTGLDASNELTELIMEASLRIAMPAPYVSLRLHDTAPERYWQAAAHYVIGGLGFPIVNDTVLIPAFLRHGRSLADARDYICSCCYENTIPGREAFHPNGSYLSLLLILELTLNNGRTMLSGRQLGPDLGNLETYAGFDELMKAYTAQLDCACGILIDYVNRADEHHMRLRRYPLMSLFIDDCIAKGRDVCEGGSRYNPTGTILAGLPNVVNSLAAIRECVFERGSVQAAELRQALSANFSGYENMRQKLLASPKWGNGSPRVDAIATEVTDAAFTIFSKATNPRGGPWQTALYSFVANYSLGEAIGATADGRGAGEHITRNLNPSWGSDREGPTAVLQSLGAIDFTKFPNGSSLDLRFDPADLTSDQGRELFADFLKGFVKSGVMQMQLSMVGTEELLDARAHPEKWPNLMVKVAGYSARFVDLRDAEQLEIIGRTSHRLSR